LGNGELGVRGFCTQYLKDKPEAHGIFRAGLFEEIKPGITDMVQLPDLLTLQLEGSHPGIIRQVLDLRTGTLVHEWEDGAAAIRTERIVSMADKQLICIKMAVTAREDITIRIHSAQSPMVRNLLVHDDQMTRSTDTMQLLESELLFQENRHPEGTLNMRTIQSNQPVEIAWRCLPLELAVREIALRAGETVTLEKRVRISVRGERLNPEPQNPWSEHAAAWAALWADCDIELNADNELQGALRYNIFQMLANNAADDPTTSIGARGLTHSRYKGNAFWDTEIFLAPFFTWTRPRAAKNLLLYRANLLDAARALAAKQSLSGARFSWMSARDGQEQCESWDIGACEVHITADICYAMRRYVEVSDDKAFEAERAAEVYLETARYWESRVTWEEARGQYSLFFVKGPDEYCGTAINNTYTNYLARYNLQLAQQYSQPELKERERFANIEANIPILYDAARDLYLHDELLERLEPMPLMKDSDAPAYHRICFDRLQRYRVLKQADLILLMNLFPNDFTVAQKRNVFAAYEPITLHDSSLSFGSHAQLALRIGEKCKAETYLRKALLLDLWDILGNTGREGLHMAAHGAAWQAMVFGAAGLWSDEGVLTVDPKLPPSVQGMRFTVRHRGKKQRISIDGTQAVVEEV